MVGRQWRWTGVIVRHRPYIELKMSGRQTLAFCHVAERRSHPATWIHFDSPCHVEVIFARRLSAIEKRECRLIRTYKTCEKLALNFAVHLILHLCRASQTCHCGTPPNENLPPNGAKKSTTVRMRKEMKTEKLSNFLYGGVFLSHFSIQIQKGSEQEISAENEKVLCPLLTHITMVLHHDGGASVGERWLFIGISSEGVTVYGGVSYGEVPFPFFPSPRDHCTMNSMQMNYLNGGCPFLVRAARLQTEIIECQPKPYSSMSTHASRRWCCKFVGSRLQITFPSHYFLARPSSTPSPPDSLRGRRDHPAHNINIIEFGGG